MRIKVYVVKAKHKMLASLLLNEINSKLGYNLVTACTLISQEMVNISCKTPIFCIFLRITINYP